MCIYVVPCDISRRNWENIHLSFFHLLPLVSFRSKMCFCAYFNVWHPTNFILSTESPWFHKLMIDQNDMVQVRMKSDSLSWKLIIPNFLLGNIILYKTMKFQNRRKNIILLLACRLGIVCGYKDLSSSTNLLTWYLLPCNNCSNL